MGNQGINMCCNTDFIAKGHELVGPDADRVHRVQEQKYREEMKFEGNMNITDR